MIEVARAEDDGDGRSSWAPAGAMVAGRIHVEAWDPEYGSPVETDSLAPTDAPVDADVEVAAARWAPLDPPPGTASAAQVLFVDGVRRIDARVWLVGADGTPRSGICASYAAGVVRCEDRATVEALEVRRGLFAPVRVDDAETGLPTRAGDYPLLPVASDDPEQLSLGLQQRMGELEVEVAARAANGEAANGELLVLDGPLTGRQNIPGALGYVKSHRVAYLPPPLDQVVGRLGPGQRTPLFLTQASWSRYSWYLRLPGASGHPWAGVVRCEVSGDLPPGRVREIADRSARTLPRFASASHKDPRAPQNLYPIAALERELRRRLGDRAYVYRMLRSAARA